MTSERKALLLAMVDAIDLAAIHDREVRPLARHPNLLIDLATALDRVIEKADGRPVRYMPVFE